MQKIHKICVFVWFMAFAWQSATPKVVNFDSLEADYGQKINLNAVLNPRQNQLIKVEEAMKKACPASIFTIFDKQNPQRRSIFAKNCKTMIRDYQLGGEFGWVKKNLEVGQFLEYGFFKGHKNAEKMVVIAGGGFFDKHFALPYVILLNKILGYSCLIVDYRGHENSWEHSPNLKNPLYSMRRKSSGVDSSSCTFGEKEGEDFCNAAMQILAEKKFIKEVYALGACFGGVVVARAQNFSKQFFDKPLFKKLFLISPLPNIRDLLIAALQSKEALTKFTGNGLLERNVGQAVYGAFNRAANANFSWFNNSIARFIAWKLQIKLFDGLAEYAKINEPVIMLTSQDVDRVVTKSMAEKVWHTIPSKNKTVFWSSGVGHLFNWFEETAELLVLFENFFA